MVGMTLKLGCWKCIGMTPGLLLALGSSAEDSTGLIGSRTLEGDAKTMFGIFCGEQKGPFTLGHEISFSFQACI